MLASEYHQYDEAPPVGQTYNPEYTKARDCEKAIHITLTIVSIALIAGAAIGGLAAAIIFMLPVMGLGLTIIVAVIIGVILVIGGGIGTFASVGAIGDRNFYDPNISRFIPMPQPDV